MNLSLDVPTALEYFSALVQCDADFPLLETAISLAQDEYPELDVGQVLSEVDQLLARLRRRIPADAGPLQKLRAVNQFFFRDLKFSSNVNHYYDPDNSYVNVVLGTRRAIPITLAVLWLELAQGLGLSARGVGFPGHFMVKVNLPKGQVVIDPLDGQSLSREQLAERLAPHRQGRDLMDEHAVPLALFLQVTPPRDIIGRMLRNLKEIHTTQQDWPRLIAVQSRLIVLLPQVWDEYRARGLAYAETGRSALALQDLETYLANVDHGVEWTATAQRAAELKRATS